MSIPIVLAVAFALAAWFTSRSRAAWAVIGGEIALLAWIVATPPLHDALFPVILITVVGSGAARLRRPHPPNE